ncbi:DUF6902 family protein [Alloyangia pacifica]|uniref:DUF6902 family protein n=1 Tax=Alloyangia pacifica TaxID=311180 RepID=UPI001CFE9DD3|nr:hypothetical protein [Alloyangia pacifica]
MSNIVALRPAPRVADPETRIAALIAGFAQHRRCEEDVFWLKENAELLNILECTGTRARGWIGPQALLPHAELYAGAEARLAFFPQYYRFLLSIVLDLEDLGMPGDTAARMAESIAASGAPEAELSDLQRMEARRLLARRDLSGPDDPGLEDRLRGFCARPGTFALPNKKAAYELTHIVFYLSEYGRRDPALEPEALTSLQFAGHLAFLEQNSDLLAEVCIALRYAGAVPPALWTGWLSRETHLFHVGQDAQAPLQDGYHDFLVCNWHLALAGEEPFRKPLVPGGMRFERAGARIAPLRELSRALFAMKGGRCADWVVMRRRMEGALPPMVLDLLDLMARETAHFDAFFEGFARAGRA